MFYIIGKYDSTADVAMDVVDLNVIALTGRQIANRDLQADCIRVGGCQRIHGF